MPTEKERDDGSKEWIGGASPSLQTWLETLRIKHRAQLDQEHYYKGQIIDLHGYWRHLWLERQQQRDQLQQASRSMDMTTTNGIQAAGIFTLQVPSLTDSEAEEVVRRSKVEATIKAIEREMYHVEHHRTIVLLEIQKAGSEREKLERLAVDGRAGDLMLRECSSKRESRD